MLPRERRMHHLLAALQAFERCMGATCLDHHHCRACQHYQESMCDPSEALHPSSCAAWKVHLREHHLHQAWAMALKLQACQPQSQPKSYMSSSTTPWLTPRDSSVKPLTSSSYSTATQLLYRTSAYASDTINALKPVSSYSYLGIRGGAELKTTTTFYGVFQDMILCISPHHISTLPITLHTFGFTFFASPDLLTATSISRTRTKLFLDRASSRQHHHIHTENVWGHDIRMECPHRLLRGNDSQ
jgi:hypothetical protein